MAGRLARRIASFGRYALRRTVATPLDRVVHWRSGALVPPAHLRIYYYGTSDREVFARACAGARAELVSRALLPEHRVLDVGCGVGNLALGLKDYLRAGYDGVDVHREAVAWCQSAITPRHPAFRFHHADLKSEAYNPGGRSNPAAYRFPFPDARFDYVFLSSVFTHMLPDAVESYVREIARLLAPGGLCVASYFLLNDETRAAVHAGRSFIPFDYAHPSGVCRLHNPTTPESAVALEEGFVRRAHEEARLVIRDIRRGEWAFGRPHDQDVLTVSRASSGPSL